ncbi:hypothetical protein A3D00_01490 [Candidatus Woesebacteria bacterium RIFCSPHIGHO2_02_FULL_38_9]|uniref:Cell division protein FtsX n=1 Tax=Candidatus Roizmanbacteria bacterium RIFCSPLOWO2_01_FULL_41_22 TaxID=1802067 RepID=A0A1F7JAL6_9BACT|nr:MAG: hypothetical protein A2966_02240 [Candidatus Roizmanbacteria bacterium RIFCSPLOWO2_01_FULL_41_22]OGM32116.1 MAG: hypothetical protein A3D00_01490 [Candidatus Woesebacteria bacterium RIFCSPHIGHO2_02_FULL_38_9]
MKDVISSLKRTPYQTSAAFLVLLFTLMLSGILFVSLSFLSGLLQYVETRPQVMVYFQSKAQEGTILKVRDELMSSGKVASVKYVSKQQAFNIYKNSTKDNPLLLAMTSADILPASLEINAQKPEYLPQIADFLKKQPGVDEVQFQKNIVDRLLTLTSIVRKATVILFSYLFVMSIIVLVTTTSFKIALNKEEIELLELLGADRWYIKKPFISESVFLGLAAALLASGILVSILFSLSPFLANYLRGINELNLQVSDFTLPIWPINLIFLTTSVSIITIFGIGIAFIASYFGTERYLS